MSFDAEKCLSEHKSDFENLFFSEVNNSENKTITWVKLKDLIEKFQEIANLNINNNILNSFLNEDSTIFKENFDKNQLGYEDCINITKQILEQNDEQKNNEQNKIIEPNYHDSYENDFEEDDKELYKTEEKYLTKTLEKNNSEINNHAELGDAPEKKLEKPVVSLDQKTKRTLFKIFQFYSKKAIKNETFERISVENLQMSMNIFFIFLKDFKVLSKNFSYKKVLELYRKNALPSQELTFELFLIILKAISQDFYSNEELSENDKFTNFLSFLNIHDHEKLQEKIPHIKQIINSPKIKKIEAHSKINAQINKEIIPHDQQEKKDVLPTKQTYSSPFNKNSKKLDFKKILPHKLKNLYQLNQQKSLINKLNLKKETTLKKLEELSINDLKPFQDPPINLEELIEKNTGDDDIYLAEYPLNFDRHKNENLNEMPALLPKKTYIVPQGSFLKKSKSKSPPKQKNLEIGEIDNINKKNFSYLMGSPRNGLKINQYKNQIVERANKIELETKEKENKIISKVIDNQQYKINVGLKVLKNY